MNRVNIVDKARKIHKACINGESASYVVDELRILREELRKEIPLDALVREKIAELTDDLQKEIETCRMDISGGNSMNVNDALQTLKELKEYLSNFAA